ncbi:MAG: hypothetical protein AMS18_01765 [Gemmatimonas sp. SG8_17]|nr:MAG: hypothetical protein AMS18_01765 [Gemmatimonas sp. SG8_17]
MASEPQNEKQDWSSSLSRALRDEARVLEQLCEAMVQQRARVAANDNDGLEASARAIGRTLFTLDAARKRRAAVMSYLTGQEELPLTLLEDYLGKPLPLELETARGQLRLAAQAVTHEAAINRGVLQGARASADTFLQELFSALTAPDAVYHAGERGEENSGAPGVIFNRIA